MYRIFFNFAKSCILSYLSKFYNKKKFTMPFLKYKSLKGKLRVFSASHSVAMVTYCLAKIIPTRSPVIGQVFDPWLYHQLIKSGYNDTSKSTSWNALETVLSHLKVSISLDPIQLSSLSDSCIALLCALRTGPYISTGELNRDRGN